jgi:thiamine-phosphate pyrophosphorylase
MPRRQCPIPRLWLLTDERVPVPLLLAAVARLPRGSGVIVRHDRWDEAERADLARRIARAGRGLRIVVAGSPLLARRLGADGCHERRPVRPRRLGRADWLRTAPVHDLRQLRRAERAGVDAVLLSPLFATRSHLGARPLGGVRFAALARLARVPVIALGGMTRARAAMAQRLGGYGWAAIDGLVAGRVKLSPSPFASSAVETRWHRADGSRLRSNRTDGS